MKSIKTMLLGIALLFVAICGILVWMTGWAAGAILFYVGLIIGLTLCFVGFFAKEQ